MDELKQELEMDEHRIPIEELYARLGTNPDNVSVASHAILWVLALIKGQNHLVIGLNIQVRMVVLYLWLVFSHVCCPDFHTCLTYRNFSIKGATPFEHKPTCISGHISAKKWSYFHSVKTHWSSGQGVYCPVDDGLQ